MPTPTRFLVFVDSNRGLAALNLPMTGTICSAPTFPGQPDWLDVLEGRAPAAGLAVSPFALRVLASDPMRRIEAEIERVRRSVAPAAPCRTTALYALEDAESALLAADRHGWHLPEVQMFRAAGPIRVARVDMEFVSSANFAFESGLELTDPDTWWASYWRGEIHPPVIELRGTPNPGAQLTAGSHGVKPEPIWEWLIEGCLEATGEAIPTEITEAL